MMKLPEPESINDKDVITVAGPNNTPLTYVYDKQSRALYRQECDSTDGCRHGDSHVNGIDPIPLATCLSNGLMSADDKCMLESKIGTRIAVMGYSGSGIPDDGGFLGGDILFASKSSFIRIERFGNVITFNVDIPIPLSCGTCDECSELYLVQDETDVNAVRPPTCAGKLPGLNIYNDFTVNLIGNTNSTNSGNVSDILNRKSISPTFIFKRTSSGDAFIELVLKRNSANSQASVGWKFTPNTTTGTADCTYHMGLDQSGNQIRLNITPSNIPKALGLLEFNGVSITKQPAVVVDYTTNVLNDNKYQVRLLDIQTTTAIGDNITAQNMWKIENPLNSTTGQNPRKLALDYTYSLLDIGTVVDLVVINVGAGVKQYYFSSKPEFDTAALWSKSSEASFGPFLGAKNALDGSGGSRSKLITSVQKNIEKSLWGITGILPYRILTNNTGTGGEELISDLFYDTELPGLSYDPNGSGTTHFVWSRQNLDNAILKLQVGKPTSTSGITNIDIPLRSAFDSYEQFIGQVTAIQSDGSVAVSRIHGEPSPHGVMMSTNGGQFAYQDSYVDINDVDTFVLVGINDDMQLEIGDTVISIPDHYDQTMLRFEFKALGGAIELKVMFGEFDSTLDSFTGTTQGSGTYTQNASFTGVGTRPSVNVPGFIVYDGGSQIGGILPEYWNDIEIMVREEQLWIWWNKLLIVPSTGRPYFNIPLGAGKAGIKMVNNVNLRKIEIYSQVGVFSEFQYGNLQII